MHHLRESRKVVVGGAGFLCGLIGWRGCHSCYHTLPIVWGGGDDSTMQHKYIGDMVQRDQNRW
jgi:hypothetical protein